MGAEREVVHFGPRFHGPRVAWYKPHGLALLVVWAAWRYFITGRPLWGRGDNAGFFTDATVDHRGGPRERLTRARWRRVAARWAVGGVPGLLLALAWISRGLQALGLDRWWTRIPWTAVLGSYLIVGGVLAAVYGGRLVVLWWPVRELRKTYVYPAYATLCRSTGVKYHRRDALRAIVLPPGFPDEVDEAVRVYVPDAVPLDGKRKDAIVAAIGPRLGLPDATARWTEAGVERAYVDLLPQQLPPATVTLAALRDEMALAGLDEPVVGIAAGGGIVHMDFRNDSPHSLGSAGSGAGKSTLYKLIAMQRLAHGAYGIILDVKKWSHLRWAGRLPAGRVLIADDVPEIHAILVRVLDELMWRKSFDLHQEAELLALPRLDVYVEEINTLMDMLVQYWKAEAARRKQEARTALRRAKAAEDEVAMEDAEEMMAEAMGLPIISPAVQALRYGVNMGREFGCHFHFIGQSMSAKAAGGRDTRESFRTRFMARWDAKTWKMLADGIPFVACPSTEPGIWAHVHGGEYEIVRVPYVRDEDAVAYVQAGTRPSLPMFHGDPVPVEADASPAALPLAGLAPLAGKGLEALRKAAQRPGFPAALGEKRAGVAALYPVDEVLAYCRERMRPELEAG